MEDPPRERRIDDGLFGVVVVEGWSDVCHLYERALVALGADDTETARGLYRQALDLEPTNAQGHIGLGTCALQEKKFELASRSYRDALALDAESASAHVGLGSVHYQQRRFAASAEHYKHAVRLREDLPDAHWGAASAFQALGDRGAMRTHAARFLALAPDSTLVPRARAMLAISALRFALRRLFSPY